MTIFVTGATGFIGRALLDAIEGEFRYSVRNRKHVTCKEQFFIDSIDEDTNWSGAFDGCQSVIHLAGAAHSKHSAEEFVKVNVDGTRHLAYQAAKQGVKRFVFVSSIGVNGGCTFDKPFSNVSLANPHNAYTKSKLEAELALREISNETGIEVVIVRPTLVYGPLAPGNFGSLSRLINKFSILPFGLANNKRDFIAVQNLADLLLICATNPNAAGHTFLASDGETVSIKAFTNAIAKAFNKPLVQLPIPVSLIYTISRIFGKLTMAEQLFGNLQVDSADTRKILGWVPPLTMEQAMTSLSEDKI